MVLSTIFYEGQLAKKYSMSNYDKQLKLLLKRYMDEIKVGDSFSWQAKCATKEESNESFNPTKVRKLFMQIHEISNRC